LSFNQIFKIVLQEAFKTMPEDEFLRQSGKAINNLKDLVKTQ
jgi:hypothetical protein